MNKLLSQLFSLLKAGLAGMGIRNSQEANFQLIFEEGPIQIRLYSPMLIAKTEVETDYNQAGKIGFNRLAGYIFGKNAQQQEMAMTTPVFREAIGNSEILNEVCNNNTWNMAFVMPPGFDLSTLPEPSDSSVTIESIPSKKVACIRYAGSLNLDSISEYSQILITWLDQHHYKRLSTPRSAAYDPPWTIPSLRRNEIHIDIE